MPEQDGFGEVLSDITGGLVAGRDSSTLLRLVTDGCAELLGVAATGVMLVDPRGGVEVVSASDERARFVEVLQSQVEQGPCLDCIREADVVSVEDLEREQRWPEFVSAALEVGYRAVHALPLRLGGRAVGGLNLLHTAAVPFPAEQRRWAQALADLAVLGLSQEPDVNRRAERLAEQTMTALNDRVALGQVVGLVAGSLDISPERGRALVEAHASHRDVPLREFARSVAEGEVSSAEIESVPRARERPGHRS
ncbi:GAF domain-containing protein [Qaidamihabitans albus]|uniref:GAF domain-containing protein n=1 Tax=Qaidamihabitans albus TaxID=2795733 RepID=UPI0027DB12E3|nr:GAF domain-containing protein [Qaidamihabitans albus]